MQNIRNGFQLVTACSVVGLSAIAFLTSIEATRNYGIWLQSEQAKTETQARAGLETQRAESAKAIADAYAKNQIAQFNQLLIRGYTFNDQAPQVDWNHTVDPSKKTIIYDQYRRCVGYALQGTFYFVKYYPEACNT